MTNWFISAEAGVGAMNYLVVVVGACLMLNPAASFAQAQGESAGSTTYKPTVEDWIGVNAAVDNYTLGLELQDPTRYDKAFWPEATIIAQPEPGLSFTRSYREAAAGPPKPPPGVPALTNAIGTTDTPWHLALSHHFEFQSASRATHYGYFVSVYPDLMTKKTVVGLPGHYDDILEKRNGEWRILQRKTVIGVK